MTIHELKKCLIWNVNELCNHVLYNTADSRTLPSPNRADMKTNVATLKLAEGKKSYQVPPHSAIDDIKYKLPVNLREQTTGSTKVINFWDTNIVYDLINKKEHALVIVNDLASTNLMTETTQQEVRISDNYFRNAQKQPLYGYTTLLATSRREMICECILEALGLEDVDVNTMNDIKIWVEACLVASCHKDCGWEFNLISWNHFLVTKVQRLVLGGAFSLDQFGIDTLVPVCRPPTISSDNSSTEFQAKLEQLRKSYPLRF